MIQEIVRVLLTGCVFGSICFFASVVTPTIFQVLDGDEGARFLRAVFPRYYLFLVITAAFGAFSSWEHPLQALGLGFISLSTLYVRQVAVPKINLWRDQQMDGDKAAAVKFKKGHRSVVALNIAQLVIAGAVLARIAA